MVVFGNETDLQVFLPPFRVKTAQNARLAIAFFYCRQWSPLERYYSPDFAAQPFDRKRSRLFGTRKRDHSFVSPLRLVVLPALMLQPNHEALCSSGA